MKKSLVYISWVIFAVVVVSACFFISNKAHSAAPVSPKRGKIISCQSEESVECPKGSNDSTKNKKTPNSDSKDCKPCDCAKRIFFAPLG